MKKVLVYPCGTEIALEIYRSLRFSTHYEIWGGSDSDNHGRFVYTRYIDNLHFISDESIPSDIMAFNSQIRDYSFSFIYPAMDGVLTVFSKYHDLLEPVVIAPEYQTTMITRSKRLTYDILNDIVPIPEVYDIQNVKEYPVFIKPYVGQGSIGARKISSPEELEGIDSTKYLCLEYLPGSEYTVDCLTNNKGRLIYARGRKRGRIKGGISVNSSFTDRPEFWDYALRINDRLKQKGGWFFQMKESREGSLKLLEVSSRIAGTSSITRCIGVNLPLLSVNIFDGHEIDYVSPNEYTLELDRAYLTLTGQA